MIKPSYTATENVDVVVVGGGISGLSTAWWLAQKGLNVQVWEKSSRPGGKIKSDFQNGFLTEQSASMVMNFKAEVDELFSKTGLDTLKASRLLEANSKRYLIHQGKLQSLPMTIASLFLSPLWSSSGKFRLLMEPFISRSGNDNETVSQFVTRRFGKEFLEKAMEPFIAGTLASDPDLACAKHVIPRLTALEKRFGSITAGIFAHKMIAKRTARNPEAFSFTGGMQTMVDTLSLLPEIGFKPKTQVNHIIKHHDYDWEVRAQGQNGEITCRARHVVIASPADITAKIIEPIHQQLSNLLKSIDYAPVSVVHIGLPASAINHPLDSVGFLVPRREKQQARLGINGNLWMSSVFADRAPENTVLLSSYLGGSRDPLAVQLSEQDSIDKVLTDIEPLLGCSVKSSSTPLMAKVDKHQQALPLYYGNYDDKMVAMDKLLQDLPGMHLQANYKGGVSIRDRIVEAKKTAISIAEQLTKKDKNKQLNSNYVEIGSMAIQA